MVRAVAVIVVAILALPLVNMITVARAEPYAYIAIRDYLGRVWTIDDLERMKNASIGGSGLMDGFRIVIDNNVYSVDDFIPYPYDGETAVLQLLPGTHSITVVWYAYMENYTVALSTGLNILDIHTAPVIPFPYSIGPTTKWVVEGTAEGIKVRRDDDTAYILFKKDTSFISVYWIDERGVENYGAMNIKPIAENGLYFTLTTAPSSTQWPVKENVEYFGYTFTRAVVDERVNYTSPGMGILFLQYIYTIAKPEAHLYRSWKFFNVYASLITKNPAYILYTWFTGEDEVEEMKKRFIDVVGDITNDEVVQVIVNVYCSHMGIVILVHGFYKAPGSAEATELDMKHISDTAVSYRNYAYYIVPLSHGQILYQDIDTTGYNMESWWDGTYIYDIYLRIVPGERGFEQGEPHTGDYYIPYYIKRPTGTYRVYHMDDMSKYSVYALLSMHAVLYGDAAIEKNNITIGLVMEFNDTFKADVFENKLVARGIGYNRIGNKFVIKRVTHDKYVDSNGLWMYYSTDFTDILNLVPEGSSGSVYVVVSGEIRVDGDYPENTEICIDYIAVQTIVSPHIHPVTFDMYINGYTVVNNAYAVKLLPRVGNDLRDVGGVIGYYLLYNKPPETYVYYTRELLFNGSVNVVDTVVLLPRDIVDKRILYFNTSLNGSKYTYTLWIPEDIGRFTDVAICFFDWERMSFVLTDPSHVPLLITPPQYSGDVFLNYTGEIVELNTTDVRAWYLHPYNGWVRVFFRKNGEDYGVYRRSDGVHVETIEVNTTSDYIYTIEFSMGNKTGRLYNDDGVLKLYVANTTILFSPIQLYGIAKELAEKLAEEFRKDWENNVANMLGLRLPSIPWNIVLLALGALAILFILLVLLAARGSRVVIQYAGRGTGYG